MKILVVEGQRRLAFYLRNSLTAKSYTVVAVGTCAEADNEIRAAPFDIVVLDIGVSDGDGLEILTRWRSDGVNVPVLILSGRNTVQDKIEALDLGADDYLAKPFIIEEFLAHVRALVRRQSSVKSSKLQHRGLKMDLIGHIVRLEGEAVDMTNREFALLEIFMQNTGRVLTRTVIAEKIWGSPYDIDTNLLDVYMSRLRGKLECDGKQRFKTVRGVGYQFI